jgi:hypothetical protein
MLMSGDHLADAEDLGLGKAPRTPAETRNRATTSCVPQRTQQLGMLLVTRTAGFEQAQMGDVG